MCVEPRIPEKWNGKDVALENDLCLCRCATPPRLVPNQTLRCQYVVASGNANTLEKETTGIGHERIETSTFDDRFAIFEEVTGEVLRHTEYAIKRADGRIEFGTTDHLGHTHLLTAEANAESVDIYV